MVMKLHHLPGSRSCRVRWLLEELGLDFELVTHALGGATLRDEAYRSLNPLGRVPTLEVDGMAFSESGAIVQFLLERHGGGRFEPAPESADRAIYLQWFHFGEATLLPPIVSINSNRFVLRPEDRSERALDVARRQLARVLAVVDRALEGREMLMGDEFTAADIMVGYGVNLAHSVGELPEAPREVHRWFARLAERPAYQTAFAGGFGGET